MTAEARFVADLAAAGYRDPASRAIPGTGSQAQDEEASAAEASVPGAFLAVQDAATAVVGGAGRRGAKQASLFTQAEMGAPQMDLFGRRRK